MRKDSVLELYFIKNKLDKSYFFCEKLSRQPVLATRGRSVRRRGWGTFNNSRALRAFIAITLGYKLYGESFSLRGSKGSLAAALDSSFYRDSFLIDLLGFDNLGAPARSRILHVENPNFKSGEVVSFSVKDSYLHPDQIHIFQNNKPVDEYTLHSLFREVTAGEDTVEDVFSLHSDYVRLWTEQIQSFDRATQFIDLLRRYSSDQIVLQNKVLLTIEKNGDAEIAFDIKAVNLSGIPQASRYHDLWFESHQEDLQAQAVVAGKKLQPKIIRSYGRYFNYVVEYPMPWQDGEILEYTFKYYPKRMFRTGHYWDSRLVWPVNQFEFQVSQESVSCKGEASLQLNKGMDEPIPILLSNDKVSIDWKRSFLRPGTNFTFRWG